MLWMEITILVLMLFNTSLMIAVAALLQKMTRDIREGVVMPPKEIESPRPSYADLPTLPNYDGISPRLPNWDGLSQEKEQ